MLKIRRVERIAALAKMLVDRPQELLPLSFFCEYFGIAKSTLSEDILSVRRSFALFRLGVVETVYGAAGGVRYIPYREGEAANRVLTEIAARLTADERIIPGGFLYMSDILYDWRLMNAVGEIFMTRFAALRPDCIMTVETKGILPAMMVARAFNKPLVIARRDSRVTEGSALSINYVSGSTKRIQTMSLTKRALAPGRRVLIIDDFMKAGGTAKGMRELVRESGSEAVGVGVLVATAEPERKLVEAYMPLLVLREVNEEARRVRVEPQLLAKEAEHE
ncbi:MAG: pur operon repressor [Veillonellaceae bacterium]|nr:pur operon repressor [Veillonellaceae bacterium]